MKNKFYILILIISFFSFHNCDTATLSKKDGSDLSKIKAEIKVSQNPYDNQDNSVEVRLYNEKGKKIDNEEIEIFVNKVKLELKNLTGLYYTRKVFFLGENIPNKDSFNIHIKLIDGKHHTLGAVGVAPQVPKNTVWYNKKPDVYRDFQITWDHLEDYSLLNVGKSIVTINENTKTYKIIRGKEYMLAATQKSFTIPSTYLGDNISSLVFKLLIEKEGDLNPSLRKGSSFLYKKTIKNEIDF